MITAHLLPSFAPALSYPSQVLIALLEGTLPTDDGVSSRWNQGDCSGLPAGARALLKVIRSLSAHRLAPGFCRLEQRRQDIAVERLLVRQERRRDVVGGGIHRDVEFTPRPPFIRPGHSDFPLSLAIDFQTR